MPSKLRIGYPEARCQVTDRGDQNQLPQARPQAQEALPLCQY
jgi:hypothetical protein